MSARIEAEEYIKKYGGDPVIALRTFIVRDKGQALENNYPEEISRERLEILEAYLAELEARQ